MKKLILSMMLIMIFLSFYNNKDIKKTDFNDPKLKASYNEREQKKKIMLTYVFSDSKSLLNDIDRPNFGNQKLRIETTDNREEQKRKRIIMLTNVFND